MLKRLLLCLAAVAAGIGIFFSVRTQGRGASAATSTLTTQQAKSLPEHVPYMFLFEHHSFNLRKASELERQGKDATFLRSMFKSQVGMSDAESAIFDQVAQDCERELAQQDAKAQVILLAFKAKFPGGVLPQGGGRTTASAGVNYATAGARRNHSEGA